MQGGVWWGDQQEAGLGSPDVTSPPLVPLTFLLFSHKVFQFPVAAVTVVGGSRQHKCVP